MISVIIPTCDRPANFLLQAVNSALGQSHAPQEVIVVDNGTQEADPTILPDGISYYRLPPRIGPSRARNFGAAMAKGTHLAFLDDDDWWDIDFLREAWAVLKAEGTRCVYGRKDRFENGTIQPYKCPKVDTLTVPYLLRSNPGTGGVNLVIEKTLFWSIGGFDENLYTSEDKALAIEILKVGEKISIAEAAAAIVRSHSGERLRLAPLRKLRFVWKYRAFFGLLRGLSEVSWIFHAHFKARVRSIFRRG